MARTLAALVLAALVAPAAASAHATLLRTSPADGARLARAPRVVRVLFDDVVQVGRRNAAVANADGASVLGGRVTARGRTLTIPLRSDLAGGAYSVRWSIVSDDGHPEVGTLAFAVGASAALPQSILDARAPLSLLTVVLRTLWYGGLLAAAGAAALDLLVRKRDPVPWRKPLAQLLFFALLLAFVGGSGLAHGVAGGSRFAIVMDVALVVALVGATMAALAPGSRALLLAAQGCSLALLVAPALAGHALDDNQPAVIAPLVDLAHLGAAALWLGGLVWLASVVPRAVSAAGERREAARRFSATALVAVAVLGLTGLGRALTELDAPREAWTTSYGRALLVKTALFLPLLGVGWLSRHRVAGAFTRLQRSVRVELVAIGGIVVTVAVLTQLPPGRDVAPASAAPAVAGPPALPPRDAVVAARELGGSAVAVARSAGVTTVTVLGPDANGVDGLDVSVDGRATTTCGSGCYRGASGPSPRLRVTVGARSVAFDLPVDAPDATALLARVTRAYRGRRTISYRERLASTPTNAQLSVFEVAAPHRLRYTIAGGAQAVVVGGRRWDRATPRARWIESPQTPLDVTQPYWRHPTNVHLVAPRTLTFLDRSIPAWFALTLDRRGRLPRRLAMTAAAHFMVDRYSSFDGPVDISPPASSR